VWVPPHARALPVTVWSHMSNADVVALALLLYEQQQRQPALAALDAALYELRMAEDSDDDDSDDDDDDDGAAGAGGAKPSPAAAAAAAAEGKCKKADWDMPALSGAQPALQMELDEVVLVRRRAPGAAAASFGGGFGGGSDSDD